MSIEKEIQFMEMRSDLIKRFYDLSDLEFQITHWVDPDEPGRFYWYFGCAIDGVENHGLIDGYPTPGVGVTFRSQEEIEKGQKVGALIHEILERDGRRKKDCIYLNSPRWPRLVVAAKEAYDLMRANDEACGYKPEFTYKHDNYRKWTKWEKLQLKQRRIKLYAIKISRHISITKNINITEAQDRMLYSLYDLSDLEFQITHWVDPSEPIHFYRCFKYATDDLENHGLINGFTVPGIERHFLTQEEIEKGQKVALIIDEILERDGRKKKDCVYLNSPRWPQLVAAAKEAYDLMRANDDACGYKPEFTYKHDNYRKWTKWEKFRLWLRGIKV